MPAGGELRIGLLGLGQVGGGVAHIFRANASEIEARLGARLRLVRALVRDPSKERPVDSQGVPLVTDAEQVVRGDDVDIVVELLGGLEPARTLVLDAIARGKSVVTANKALLAEHGPEIFAAATKASVDVLFEAAVCGGIPIIRTLREALASDRIESIRGIVNGTTNYILSAMEEGQDYAATLARAQKLGFAEADPSFDVSGKDAAQKLLILASLAFGVRLSMKDVPAEGIEHVSAADFANASEFGFTIKLLASAQLRKGVLSLGVRPTLVPQGTPLATIRGAFNAVEVRSFALGPALLVGQGAGALPTGSAVVSDIIEAGRNLQSRTGGRVPHYAWAGGVHAAILAPARHRVGAWYLRFSVSDEPGVLAQIAGALGSRGISIASLIQREHGAHKGPVTVVVVTHDAEEAGVAAAIGALDQLPFSRGPTRLLAMEREEESGKD
jgi:homoserine dehydrogenase